MKFTVSILLIFICSYIQAQSDSSHFIKVHFLYGSKPTKKYKKTEPKYFGGIHGGHVSIDVDGIDYGFSPKEKFYIVSHRRKRHSEFQSDAGTTTRAHEPGYKVVSFVIPLSKEQYVQINAIHGNYCSKPPYDYAFFGMRCAAATQDVLAQIGVVKKRGRFSNIFTTFYPKKLRKRMFKLAAKKNYTIERQE